MSARHPRPISLRPLPSSHRAWFWGLIALAILLIVVGWMVTIRDIMSIYAPAIGEAVDENLTKASQSVKEAGENAAAQAGELERKLQEAKAGYEAETAKQNETKSDYE